MKKQGYTIYPNDRGGYNVECHASGYHAGGFHGMSKERAESFVAERTKAAAEYSVIFMTENHTNRIDCDDLAHAQEVFYCLDRAKMVAIQKRENGKISTIQQRG